MSARERFLTDVGAALPLPDDVRAEVLSELETHLTDATEDLISQGRDADAAESEAVARFGSPEGLARDLARAHRSGAQVWAAAGAGSWAAVRDGTLGLLVGWAFIVLATILAMLIASLVGRLLGVDTNVGLDSGWNTVLTALGLHAGALFSGAAAVRAAARSGWRLSNEVRPWVAPAGAVAWGWFAIGVMHQPLNWVSTLVMALVPASFVLGAYFERLRLPRPRVVILALLGVAIISVGLTVAVSGAPAGSSGGAQAYQWDARTHGYEMIAPWWQAPGPADQPQDFATSDYAWQAPGVATVSVEASNAAVMSRFTSFRLEAWAAEQPEDGWRLSGGQDAPMATADVTVDGTTIEGTISFNETPGVDWAEVVLTGSGPGGQRYLVAALNMPVQTIFEGSVWDWFAALTAG